ncbi:zinc-dependent alcohol dehydrogenase family protein (plasmid) [Alicyclobacillus fastidiosus]|uniref:Zinc-dependent alcohol dehydrogenase family protein n=1 Tax=Alicyclobacillus fastidiosus TaxID=392011 RepID=A0ABY6ZPS3_9BACL|nr:zinc-dependent alcohol dehydrogenase family protein [Alicyclobacillus fastidiosus]WAH44978.1 zinc-dependent alcohol dehydrogenase family protein [Alicyclobacillus fastidiosus]GMA66284.1 alcohol dehydrogenase [Alicyclobacillus fastidiosus]GMA66333.1 alcohol dehydrogenase [Alicyclobacillus fastidiosus]
MRAARIHEFRKPVIVERVPDPTPGPGDAVIRVEASGICRSDWHGWMGDWAWVGLSPQLPIIPGHEFGGEVVAVGKEVKGFKGGEKVTVPFHYGCGHCEYCHSGVPNLCDSTAIYGFSWDGSYAEYVIVRDADFNLIQLPENVDSTTAAAIGCRFMTGYHGVMRGHVQPGQWVAVQGAGGVGLSAIQTANAVGAQVIAVDIDNEKLEKARQEGAVAVVNARSSNVPEAIKEITKGGAHVGIDALGVKDTILNSVLSLRKGGRHVQIGLTTSEEGGMVALPIDAITAMELEVVGSLGNPHPAYRGLLNLVSQGRLNPKSIVEREVTLEDVNEVFDNMTNYRTKGFNIITQF